MAGLNYNHLQYFWVVAREGHLTRAAAKLHVTQSALSTQIRKLEDRLGHALFERRGRGLALTEAGRIALDYADAIFLAGEELLGTLRETGGARRRTLRVGALATSSRIFQTEFLAPVLGGGEVALTLASGSIADLMAALTAHTLDIVLVNQPPQRGRDSTWITHTLAQIPVGLVGPPARLGRARDALELLRAHPLILPSRQSSIRIAFDAFAAAHGLAPDIAVEVDDMAMMRVLAREGAGLAVLPPIIVRDEIASGLLIEAAQLPGIVETFSAVTAQRRFPDPLVDRLLAAARARWG